MLMYEAGLFLNVQSIQEDTMKNAVRFLIVIFFIIFTCWELNVPAPSSEKILSEFLAVLLAVILYDIAGILE